MKFHLTQVSHRELRALYGFVVKINSLKHRLPVTRSNRINFQAFDEVQISFDVVNFFPDSRKEAMRMKTLRKRRELRSTKSHDRGVHVRDDQLWNERFVKLSQLTSIRSLTFVYLCHGIQISFCLLKRFKRALIDAKDALTVSNISQCIQSTENFFFKRLKTFEAGV